MRYRFFQILQNTPVILLAAAITFSPRFALGKLPYVGPQNVGRVVEVRIEDFLIAFLLICWFMGMVVRKQTVMKRMPLWNFIAAWLGVSIVSTLFNYVFRALPASVSLLYVLKEVEYIAIACIVYGSIYSFHTARVVLNSWVIFLWMNVIYIIYQLANNIRTYYGPGAIGEGMNPFGITGQFLILSMYVLSYVVYDQLPRQRTAPRKFFWFAIGVIPLLTVITPFERIGVVSLCVSLVVFVFLYGLKYQALGVIKKVFVTSLCTVLLFTGLFVATPNGRDGFVSKVVNVYSYVVSFRARLEAWQTNFAVTVSNPLSALIGRGIQDDVAESSHNQYVRNFAAVGAIGSLIFFLLVYSVLRYSYRVYIDAEDSLVTALSLGLLLSTVGMLVLCLSAEAFKVARIAEHYWFFVGFSLAVIGHHAKSVAHSMNRSV